ncbi:MAG: hypothetical protein U0Q11_17815 [Vicinamibacterales bacterium]
MSLQQSLTLTHAWDLTLDIASVVAYLEARDDGEDAEPPSRARRRLRGPLSTITAALCACSTGVPVGF